MTSPSPDPDADATAADPDGPTEEADTPAADAPAATADADAPGDPSGPAAAGRRPRRGLLVVGLLAFVAVLAGLVAVIQTLRLGDRDAAVEERREVAAAAAGVAEAILSYDYTDIEGSLERVTDRIGGEFAEVYDETFRTVQVPVITQLQAVATATVRDVYVTEVDDGAAHAIVLIDQTVESTAGLRTLTGTFLQLDLVDRDGRWLVESIPLRISSRNETVTGLPGTEPPVTPESSTTVAPETTVAPATTGTAVP